MRAIRLLAVVPTLLFASETFASPRLADGSHIRMEIMEGRVEIIPVLHLLNESDDEITNVSIGLPQGAFDFRSTEGVRLDSSGDGAILAGPFPPGMTVVRMRYALPTAKDRLDFSWRPNLPSRPLSAILPELPGMEAVGSSVMAVHSREAEGLRLTVIDLIPREGAVVFSLRGLPWRQRNGRWFSLAIFVMVVLGGTIFLLGAPGPDHAAVDLERTKRNLLDELVQLDIDRNVGLIDDADHASDREELIGRLASVLRDLEEAALER